MPWRGHPDPYAVWVSEIMLQQTQVDTVRPYFTRFMETFPTLSSLANANDDALLKSWEGLGYYTRVRNLRKAAQEVIANHKGMLPTSAK
jgi:A/G-specific adenine glycosylase